MEGHSTGCGKSRAGASVQALLFPQGYLTYIKSLPLNDMPEIFGLHDNANITFAQNETYTLLGTIVQLQPKSSSAGGQSREEVSGSKRRSPAVGRASFLSTIPPAPLWEETV